MPDTQPDTPPSQLQPFRYRGPSMRSTFTPGQVLFVDPEICEIKAGDVILFRTEQGNVVHRVREVTPQGIRTRGDNNPRDDDDLVQWSQVLGRVEHVDTGDEIQLVTGGSRGLLRADFRWTTWSLFNRLRPGLGWLYRLLKVKRIVLCFWHPKIVQLALKSELGEMTKYLVNGKTVATWDPQTRQLTCRKPYDMVIQPPQESQGIQL